MSDPITTINDRLDAIKDQLDDLAQPTSAAASPPSASATDAAQQQTAEHDTPSTPPAASGIDLAALEAFRESLQQFSAEDLQKLSEPMRTPWSGEHAAGLEAPTLPNAELANPASLTSGLADRLDEAIDRLDGLTLPSSTSPTSPTTPAAAGAQHTVEHRLERIIERGAEEQRQTWARIGELAEAVEIERPSFALPAPTTGTEARAQDLETPLVPFATEGQRWQLPREADSEDYALRPPAWAQMPAAELGFDKPDHGEASERDLTADMFRKLTPEQIEAVEDRNAFGFPLPTGTEGGSPSHPSGGHNLSPLQDLFGGLVGFGGAAPDGYEQDYHEAQLLGGEGGAGDVLGLLQEMMGVMIEVKEAVAELKNQRGGEGGSGSRHEASADGPLQRKPFSMDIPDMEAEEGFPQASPSVNVSTIPGTGGAGGHGFGSKHAAPGSVLGGGTGKPKPGTGRSSFFEPGTR